VELREEKSYARFLYFFARSGVKRNLLPIRLAFVCDQFWKENGSVSLLFRSSWLSTTRSQVRISLDVSVRAEENTT
jgi:hypothetical protein